MKVKKTRRLKKQKLDEEVEELKRHLQIVQMIKMMSTLKLPLLLAMSLLLIMRFTKHNKPYFKIKRADGSHQLYLSFLSILRNFDQEDLEALWRLVKERFDTTKPKKFFDDFLLTTLGAMFESQIYKLKSGKIKEVFMVKRRRYPLTRFTLDQMLNNVRLEVEEESEVSLELLRACRIDISIGDIKKGVEAYSLQLYGYFVGTSINRPTKVGKLDVKYQWKPSLCTHCNTFGHATFACKVRLTTEKEITAKTVMDAVKVDNMASSKGVDVNGIKDDFVMVGRNNVNQDNQKGVMGGYSMLQKNKKNSQFIPKGYSLKRADFVHLKDYGLVQKPLLNSKYNENMLPKILVRGSGFGSSLGAMVEDIPVTNSFQALDNQDMVDTDDDVESEHDGIAIDMKPKYYVDVASAKENDTILSVRDDPWVIMGYFNVTLDPDEKSTGGSKITTCMSDFRDCVDNINVDNVASCRFSFTWNKRPELCRIQIVLDFDPHNNLHKGAEILCLKELNSAMKDEESFLRQNSKVEWLSEGDNNSRYFHNVVKRRLNMSIISCVEDLQGKGFSRNQLSLDDAKFMVRSVTDIEIKMMLFDIEDCKAPGLDGYFACFFKNSWNVHYLGSLVDENQRAFIPSRQISDNILLAQNIMRGYHTNKGYARCAFKIDVQDILNEKGSETRRPHVSLSFYTRNGSVYAYGEEAN
nr:hypothetical protein [Tanacetum cinerariifolium]